MGKGHFRAAVLFGPGASKGRNRCIGCQKPIVYGDRCPPCATLVRAKAAKRRRRR